MNISEQKLNEILAGIINNYSKKGSISTNALCDIMEKFDNPHKKLKFIHVAGTNGKGSIVSYSSLIKEKVVGVKHETIEKDTVDMYRFNGNSVFY